MRGEAISISREVVEAAAEAAAEAVAEAEREEGKLFLRKFLRKLFLDAPHTFDASHYFSFDIFC